MTYAIFACGLLLGFALAALALGLNHEEVRFYLREAVRYARLAWQDLRQLVVLRLKRGRSLASADLPRSSHAQSAFAMERAGEFPASVEIGVEPVKMRFDDFLATVPMQMPVIDQADETEPSMAAAEVFLRDPFAAMMMIPERPGPSVANLSSRSSAPTFAPQTFAPQNLAPQTFAPQTFAPQNLAPQDLAPQDLAPQEFATQKSPAPEFAYTEFAAEEFAAHELARPEAAHNDVPPSLLARLWSRCLAFKVPEHRRPLLVASTALAIVLSFVFGFHKARISHAIPAPAVAAIAPVADTTPIISQNPFLKTVAEQVPTPSQAMMSDVPREQRPATRHARHHASARRKTTHTHTLHRAPRQEVQAARMNAGIPVFSDRR